MLFDPKWAPAETEIKLEPWQQILLKAADILEEKGWIQETLVSPDGYCALGAMQMAHYGATFGNNIYHKYGLDKHDSEYIFACQKMGHAISCSEIYTWNDKDYRTKEHVIDKLREAAHAV